MVFDPCPFYISHAGKFYSFNIALIISIILQEFNRAYNAYSAALKLSPVGPSSHVFLSNRAAALLSLRQYSQAATDARRAIALAPTFSKAHARLGQALYFMRDYSGAVAAYEDAVQYEPDNDITKNYLQKAKEKEAKQVAKQLASRGGLGARYGNASDMSLSGSVGDSTMMGANMSVVSDPNRSAAVVSSNAGMEGAKSRRIVAVVSNDLKRSAGALSGAPLSGVDEHGIATNEVDPDFDEALRLQDKATAFLASKNYKEAIESYSAALFLVPDDIMLSPQLHIGRCHALNGLKRHTSAANDARLAIRLDPNNSEAHSALAKSLFYEGEYEDAIEAFEKSASLLAPGESVSMFDRAYLEKARECLIEEERVEDETGEESPRKKDRKRINLKAVVPKLRAPRFVSRQQAVESAPVVPSMPKTWPKQNIVQTSTGLKVGPERLVTFYSESLGIRLNRGASDGIVRVVAVKDVDADPGSPVAREGHVELGDIVREAAGVDLRRPVTGVMWSDTVALIKISPRPLELILAKELSAPPPTFLDELAKVSMQSSAPPTEVELPSSESPASNIVEEGDEEEEEEEEEENHDDETDDSDDDVELEMTYSEDGRALPSV